MCTSRWQACSRTGSRCRRCNCGFSGDAESIASLTGIRHNLLPFWLQRYPEHPLHDLDITEAAKQVRTYAEQGDEMALAIFAQQAQAIGALFTIVSNLTDPHAFFLGGGVVETTAALPGLVPGTGPLGDPPPRGAGGGGHLRARPRPRHGRCPGSRPRRGGCARSRLQPARAEPAPLEDRSAQGREHGRFGRSTPS